LKQKKTTVLISILSLVSFAIGHANVRVKDAWSEPVILWFSIVINTGTLLMSISVLKVIHLITSTAAKITFFLTAFISVHTKA
jgi:hypothetical protein